jgi:hypothetical protein
LGVMEILILSISLEEVNRGDRGGVAGDND